MEFILVTAIVAVCLGVLIATMIVLRRESIVLDEPETISFAPGRPSNYMAVPSKNPAIRTRHSRVIK